MPNFKLDHFLSIQTKFSRRDIFDLLKNHKIEVNGKKVDNLTLLINPGKDQVKVNKQAINTHIKYYYYKFNKPKGIISTLDDPNGRACLKDYLKNLEESIFPIGRLDRNTTGLLLFTNDGDLANKISHPQFEIPKVYKVTLDKPISVRDQKRLLTGILLEDGPVVFSKIELLDEAELLVTISEGRNRIVRRTFQQLSYEVKKLKRLSIGPIQLGGLAEGKFIKLSRPELNDLQRIT